MAGLNMVRHKERNLFWNGRKFVPFKQGHFYSNELKQSLSLPADGIWVDLLIDRYMLSRLELFKFWLRSKIW